MLQHIKIENYALIRALDLEFTSGFAVITGETGAGKSILLGALGLVLGQRADTQVLFDPEKKCVVEAKFDLSALDLEAFFDQHDLDYDQQCTLRREITSKSKTRAFINDTPVNASVLQELGYRLIDIHSQHETLTLNTSDFRLHLIDSVLSNPETLATYRKLYVTYDRTRERLQQTKELYQRLLNERDFSSYLYNELEALGLKVGEQALMEQALERMRHQTEIASVLTQGTQTLQDDEDSVVLRLVALENAFKRIHTLAPELKELFERLRSAHLELADMASEMGRLSASSDSEPELLQQYETRLDTIYRLQNKHQVTTVEALLEIQERLSTQLFDTDRVAQEIHDLEKTYQAQFTELSLQAQTLTQQRMIAAQMVQSRVQSALQKLGMPDARFEIRHEPLETYRPNGADTLRFLFSANLGSEPAELAKVASGGELSRLMLALKSVITSEKLLPTIIFDEIDTGVSGEIASKVADILLDLSRHMQVIAITHLPQMAAKGQRHYRVSKVVHEGRSESRIQILNSDEHLMAVAAMMSNDTVSNAAVLAAKALMT